MRKFRRHGQFLSFLDLVEGWKKRCDNEEMSLIKIGIEKG